MFLDQNLKRIQEAKNRLVLCGELRRRLVDIEVRDIGFGACRTLSNLRLGMSVAEHILGFLRKRRSDHC